jgi:DUF1680 family protein
MKRSLSTVSILFAASAILGCSVQSLSASEDGVEYRRLPVTEYIDKMKAGWIGQMAGVGWGAPTEFKFKGEIIPEDKVPAWTPQRINQYNQDDIYVEMTFLRTLEQYGWDVSIRQAGIDFANSGYRLWHANRCGRDALRKGIAPPDSGHPKFNKCADDIDYQIEADYAGLISPGMPNVGIALGEKFGRLMNYGDGVYGGQFVSGMYAEAFFETDIGKIVRAGLACIPKGSQYHECISDVLKWHAADPDDWQKTWKKIEAKYNKNPAYRRASCTDRINIDAKINGAYIVMGLLYGNRDLDKTIVISMRCGQDSDCNPSNAGGILFTSIGFSKLPERFTSALDETPTFSHTPYTFPKLIDVCTTLVRQAVERSGGRIEKDVLIIPIVAPKPPKLEQCWEPGPVANSRFTEAEMARIKPPAPTQPKKTKKKGQSPGKIDISAAVTKFAPGWTVTDCGDDMKPGLRGELQGRKNVLVTHPFSTEVPCVLRRTLAIPAGKKTALRLLVSHNPRGDWQLVVKVAGKELLKRTIGKDTTENGWAALTVDLSSYAGTSVDIALENRANGWFCEAGRWAQIRIETSPAMTQKKREKIHDIWRPLPGGQAGGLLAQRLDLWRTKRLWHMLDAEDDYLLSGFEKRPGRHPWQGEHVGKWLHAATLAYEQTRDEKLGKALRTAVDRLLAAQQPNGYMGTYGDDFTFMALPENTSKSSIVDDVTPAKKKGKKPQRKAKPRGGWDTWTFRYNLYGLLTYERYHPDERIVDACKKMGDLLIDVYGEGKADLTHYGTRRGISATTLLESIMMLYERTRDEKYLDFAERIVAVSESNPGLRLMGAMLEKGSVVYPGEGKAYQLMANLLGYLLLYKHTGDERYLKTVQNAWENIRAHHLDVAGGPWGRHMSYNGNRECFALPKDFDPAEADVETCSTTTWIQMNLHLLELTGQARYAAQAERAVFNTLMAAQLGEGIDWCYYIRANQSSRPFSPMIKCCSSSGPRALEMFSYYLIGEVDGGVSFTSLVPCTAVLPEAFGKATIKVRGDYPFSPKVGIRFEKADDKEFALEFRDPADSRLTSARINGEDVALSKNDRGFYRVKRAWKTGDEIALDFAYLLASHVETPKGGQRWVAFTYGPWTLAQKIKKGAAVAEPLVGKDVPSKAASEWLEPCPTQEVGPRFRIKGTKILLEPYYSAGDRTSGPRTYFKF